MIDCERKLSGVLIPVFALRRDGDLGIGDTASVAESIDFCAQKGLAVLQLLPVNETGGDNSPYNAISSIALDPALLTVEPGVVPGLSQEDYKNIVAESGLKDLSCDSVHYGVVKKLKLDLLRCAWQVFRREVAIITSDKAKDFQDFEKMHAAWLRSYSLFRTLIDEHNGNACWTQWPDELQSLESAEKYASVSARKESFDDSRRFYTFVQWLAFKQWTDLRNFADRKKVCLMGDIPFGISRYSADVWAHRDLFDTDWSGGAPPERFFQGDPFTREWGQNWGIPLYKWDKHKAEDFRWWRQRIERLTDVFHYFRIDHVLGFFRIYSFPWLPERNHEFINLSETEASKLAGGRLPQFLPRPDQPEEFAELNSKDGEAILKVVLQAAGKSGVVAEDLGVVPDYVRPILQGLGIPGFAIPIFERNEEDRSFKKREELAPLSLATYGTHDHWPLALYYEDLVARWHGEGGHEAWLDVQRLMKFLGLDENNPPKEFTDQLHLAFQKAILETPCWLVVFTITDLLGSREQFNAPGISSDSNWSCRLAMSLSAYEQDPVFGPKIKRLASLLQESHRVPDLRPAGTIK